MSKIMLRDLCLFEWEQIELDLYSAIESRGCDRSFRLPEKAVLTRLVFFTYGMRRTGFTGKVADVINGVDEYGNTVASPVGIGLQAAKDAIRRLDERGLITRTWELPLQHIEVNADAILTTSYNDLRWWRRTRTRALKSKQTPESGR